MSLSPSEAVELTVSSLSDKGEGLAQHQGYTCFMQDALPGERLQVRLGAPFVPNSRRRPAFIEQRLTTHPQRVPPFCPYYGRCGGCTLQTASLPLQHGLKQELIAKALRECGVGEDKLLSLYADAARPCRFKSIRRFATDAKGQLYSGFYQVRSHELTALTHCPLEPAWMGDFSAALTQVAQVQQLTAYQESSGRGCLRALLMREGDPGERLVLIVHADALPSAFIAAVQGLAAAHKIGCVACSCNRSRGNAVLGQSAEIIAGREVLVAVLASQVTSNVPAALLLSGFTQDVQALIIGTNLGGLGTLIASMASLISYRQIAREEPAGKGRYFALFTLSNLLFLAVLLALWAILA